MKRILTIIILIIVFVLNANTDVLAEELVAENSATLIKDSTNIDYRVEKLEYFFNKYNSPLAEQSWVFIKEADENGLDWRLIPAITGVESTYGKFIPKNSYNAYGWNNGNYSFKSWEESIAVVANTLSTKYLGRGYISINQIARIYAPPSSTWAGKVKFIMNQIDPLPLAYTIE